MCTAGNVLLYNGSTASANHSEGTVLVCYDNKYGTVCDDFWDSLDATVVCNQLHQTPISMYSICKNGHLPSFDCSVPWYVFFWHQLKISGSVPVLQSSDGSLSGYPIHLDNVVCTGSESSLLQCGHNPVGTHNCDSTEMAGVRCGGLLHNIIVTLPAYIPNCYSGTCMEGDVRLGVGNLTEFYISVNEYESYFFVKDELARGRVEVCVGGSYGTVCDDAFDNVDASVVCRQLGFSPHGVYVYKG